MVWCSSLGSCGGLWQSTSSVPYGVQIYHVINQIPGSLLPKSKAKQRLTIKPSIELHPNFSASSALSFFSSSHVVVLQITPRTFTVLVKDTVVERVVVHAVDVVDVGGPAHVHTDLVSPGGDGCKVMVGVSGEEDAYAFVCGRVEVELGLW